MDWLGAEGPGLAHMAVSAVEEDRTVLIPRSCVVCSSSWLPSGKKKISVLVELTGAGMISVRALVEADRDLVRTGSDLQLLDASTTMFRGGFQEGHTLTLSLPPIVHLLGNFHSTGPVWVVGLPDRLELWNDAARLARLPSSRERLRRRRSIETA